MAEVTFAAEAKRQILTVQCLRMAENSNHRSTSEEALIRSYFSQGFQYNEILEVLRKCHDIQMSISTLKRRINSYGLKTKTGF